MRRGNVGNRDANEKEIFDALKVAGCDPVRFSDFDIGAEHINGTGHMIEVKIPGRENELQPKQVKLRRIFKERFHVVTTAEAALTILGKL